ncbi:MAG: MBL fold metallo-hydrolase [Cyanobacteria bacterium P01_F01_bin.42]
MAFRRLGLSLLLGLGMALGSHQAIAQQDPATVEIKTIPLDDGIYMLTGDGGNIGLSVGDDGVFMIDDQFAALSDKIKAAIAELTAQPVKFLLNTHWHFDHVGGNENFAQDGAVVLSHDNVRKRMEAGQVIDAFQLSIPPASPAALPMLTFRDGTTLHMNGQTIGIQHIQLPAHTDGDSIVYFEEANVLHAGDTFFNGLYPFIDESSGGTLFGVISAVETMLAFTNDNTKIIPGHGPLATRADLQAYLELLRDLQGKIDTALKNKLSLKQFIALKPMAKYDDTWGKALLTPEQFLTIVYGAELRASGRSIEGLNLPIEPHSHGEKLSTVQPEHVH